MLGNFKEEKTAKKRKGGKYFDMEVILKGYLEKVLNKKIRILMQNIIKINILSNI